MKLVAAAKLRHAQDALIAARPYSRKMNELLQQLVGAMDTSIHPLLAKRPVHRVLVIAVAGDRGMCGAFNSNLAKAVVLHLQTTYADLLKKENAR